MPPLCAILPTHTPRHLRPTLLGALHQSRKPDRLIVSCDTDSDDIARVVQGVSADCNARITLVRRPFTGAGHLAQVRNNAVRALLADPPHPPDPSTRLVFLDGDCCPSAEAFNAHERLGAASNALVLGFRVDLTEDQTAAFSEDALRQHHPPITPTTEQLALLHTRHRRYQRQALLRRFGLGKPHKPKLLGANFSVPLNGYIAINGFDESYEGYGQEDDDFGRRWYRARGLPVIAITDILAFHLYHPTRAPGDWHNSPNAARFAAGARGPTKCTCGLDAPLDQPPLRIEHFNAT